MQARRRLRRLEQEPRIGRVQHPGVVVRITRRDDAEVQRLQRAALGAGLAHAVVGHGAVGVGGQEVAHQGGPAQLAQHGLGQFVEGVRQHDDLVVRPQPSRNSRAPGRGAMPATMACRCCRRSPCWRDALAHQQGMVGLAAGGAAQGDQASVPGDGNDRQQAAIPRA
jgi:hypothetical protein